MKGEGLNAISASTACSAARASAMRAGRPSHHETRAAVAEEGVEAALRCFRRRPRSDVAATGSWFQEMDSRREGRLEKLIGLCNAREVGRCFTRLSADDSASAHPRQTRGGRARQLLDQESVHLRRLWPCAAVDADGTRRADR